ncbi:MAG: hypothetical protein QFX38_07375 [Methanothermobacter sp.]|nr:hypothetical protein [Methanothermobacter sp.]
MKKFLPILVLLVVAFTFGCTGTPAEKTFSGDGITFQYPGTWENLSAGELEASLPTLKYGSANVITYLGNDTEEFAVVELKATSEGYVRSPSEWLQQMESSLEPSQIISKDESLSVAGKNAALVQWQEGNQFITAVHIKIDESKGYQLYYSSPQSDLTTFQKIIQNFNIS